MSFADLRPYFQARFANVDSDLKEWCDAFNIENIPSTIIDKSYHIREGAFTYVGTAQTCMSFSCPVNLTVCFKGYGDPKEAIDTALKMANDIVKECTKPVHRLNQRFIKNVLPEVISAREYSQSNDNIVVLEIQFNCLVALDT